MGHGALALLARRVPLLPPDWSRRGVNRIEGPSSMKPMLRSQAFRVVMFLSALASSSLVIAAGQRWR